MTWFADGSISISARMLKPSLTQRTQLSDGLRDFFPDWCKCQARACTARHLGITLALTVCTNASANKNSLLT